MPLKVGDKAPGFTLRDYEGREFSLEGLEGYRLVVFYKVTCPTCQLTLPFVERMFGSYGGKVHFLGVVQDPEEEARKFAENYGLTFPQLVDAPDYRVSVDYEVMVVPTIYLIDPEGRIDFVEESFVKASLEELNEKLARIAGREVNPLFEDVSVPAFKAG